MSYLINYIDRGYFSRILIPYYVMKGGRFLRVLLQIDEVVLPGG